MAFDTWLFRASLTARLINKELSMRVAAKQAGVSVSTISRLTKGELPDVETFAKIIAWLGEDANRFFSGDYATSPPAVKQDIEQDAWATLYHALETLGTPTDLIEAVVVIVRLVGKR